MKGGKSGRERRGAPAAPPDRRTERRTGKPGAGGRAKGVAPPKGSPKKPHFGGTSTSDRD